MSSISQPFTNGSKTEPIAPTTLLMFGQLAKYELNNWMNRNPIKAQEVGVDNISAFEPGKNSPDKAEINTGDGVAELVEPGDGISYYKEGEDRHNNVGGSVKAVLDNIESGFDVNINGDENVNGVGNILIHANFLSFDTV